MALNPDAVGITTEELVHDYRWQDVVLYALGVGATRDELDYLFEGRGPKVLPTWAVVPTFAVPGKLLAKVGGNLLGIVHGAQSIKLHKSFAAEGKLTTVGKVAGVYDLKRLAQAVFTSETRDETGDLVCETEWLIIYRDDGGFQGPRPPKTVRKRAPKREPDFEVVDATRPEQALLYRLVGDYNPLHADPAIGEKVGFGDPILHGLCTYGYVGRAVVKHACAGDPAQLASLSGQFRKPVWPGDTLVIRGWLEDGECLLRAYTKERPDDEVFSNGIATLR